jgi:hypothetical protein
VETDPYNCGGCDHVCPTSSGETPTCSEHVCGGVLTLVDGEDSPAGLTLDDQFVYWTIASGAVHRAPKRGGAAPTVVVDAPASGSGDAGAAAPARVTTSLLLVGDRLYFVRPATGSLLSVAKDGSSHDRPVTIATGEMGVVSVAVAGTKAFWGTAAGVRTAPIGGGAATTFLSRTSAVTYVASDGTSIDWYEPAELSASIYTAPVTGAAPTATLLHQSVTCDGLAFVGGSLFANLGEAIARIDGPNQWTITNSYESVSPVATDGASVAWADETVIWSGTFNGPAASIRYTEGFHDLGPASVAVDAQYIYVAREYLAHVLRVQR